MNSIRKFYNNKITQYSIIFILSIAYYFISLHLEEFNLNEMLITILSTQVDLVTCILIYSIFKSKITMNTQDFINILVMNITYAYISSLGWIYKIYQDFIGVNEYLNPPDPNKLRVYVVLYLLVIMFVVMLIKRKDMSKKFIFLFCFTTASVVLIYHIILLSTLHYYREYVQEKNLLNTTTNVKYMKHYRKTNKIKLSISKENDFEMVFEKDNTSKKIFFNLTEREFEIYSAKYYPKQKLYITMFESGKEFYLKVVTVVIPIRLALNYLWLIIFVILIIVHKRRIGTNKKKISKTKERI